MKDSSNMAIKKIPIFSSIPIQVPTFLLKLLPSRFFMSHSYCWDYTVSLRYKKWGRVLYKEPLLQHVDICLHGTLHISYTIVLYCTALCAYIFYVPSKCKNSVFIAFLRYLKHTAACSFTDYSFFFSEDLFIYERQRACTHASGRRGRGRKRFLKQTPH